MQACARAVMVVVVEHSVHCFWKPSELGGIWLSEMGLIRADMN